MQDQTEQQIDAAEGGLYDVKVEGVLGPGPEDAKAVRSLNRQIRFVPDVGIKVEADPRHAEIIAGELGLRSGVQRVVGTPGSKADAEATGADPAPLGADGEVSRRSGSTSPGTGRSCASPRKSAPGGWRRRPPEISRA